MNGNTESEKDDDGLAGDADAEKHHHERRQRHQRARIEHGHQRIERVADAHAPAHHDAERHADQDRRAEAVEKRHRAHREVVQQVAALDQIEQGPRDQARLADEQRIERHDEEDRLPGGEEQHAPPGAQAASLR